MPHVVGEPSAQVQALARALIAHPDGPVEVDDPVLAGAVRVVIDEFDSYDTTLIARTAEQPPDSPAHHALELALAHRIVVAALDLGAAAEELLDPDGRLAG